MKTTITLAALALSIIPANALTLEQAQNELAGMHCSGSSCTSSSTSTSTVENPDIVTSTTTLVRPATSDARDYANTTDANKPGFWNEKCQTIAYVNDDCTVQALNQGSGGFPAIYHTETVVTDGGTTIVSTCTTTTKTLSYNGPNTSRDKAWSVDISTSTSDGAC